MIKEIYFYEYSDDQIEWSLGGVHSSLVNCLDKMRECPYKKRIKRAKIFNEEMVSEEEIKEAKEMLQTLEKIFR